MRLLIIDYLDSYSYNIPSFLRDAFADTANLVIDVKPYISFTKADVKSVCSSYHGIVLSAGPGTVELDRDIGELTPALLSRRPAIPIYGICLGFQAICKHFGGIIRRLSLPHHGLVSDILHPEGHSLGRQGTRYHSLEVQLSENALQQLEILAIAENYGNQHDFSIMEVRHRELPFWGVQYHPESIYSSGCDTTVQSFLFAARARHISDSVSMDTITDSVRETDYNLIAPQAPKIPVRWQSIEKELDLLDVLPEVNSVATNYVLLDSSSKGEWDILAAAQTAFLFTYSIRRQHMSFKPVRCSQQSRGGDLEDVDRSATLKEAWTFLEQISSRKSYTDGPPSVPFWGGFVGYFSYELGLAELGIDPCSSNNKHIPGVDDIQLLWTTETILYHKPTKTLYAISLRHDLSWIDSFLERVRSLSWPSAQEALVPYRKQFEIGHPDERSYIEKVRAAQEEIRAGNSYEICLTATSLARPSNSSPLYGRDPDKGRTMSLMTRFRHLRKTTPATFMSLIRLGGIEALSASPEEFLSYDAHSNVALMKPIKGTLPKTDKDGKPIPIEKARKMLHEPKVIAENLMIVDLVRHDLSKVSNKVTCPKLMHVEDIGPMYQLTSTVQAEVDKRYTAWDLIRSAMPPGSMTGAPKRRSCEILQRLEQAERGLYSGITGYIDVRGHCKTSVNIRNAVQYPGENLWKIGAGGAITSLSDPSEEWHERQLKASSVCRAFSPCFQVLETILWDPEAMELTYWDEHMARLLQSIRFFNFSVPLMDSQNEEVGEACGNVMSGSEHNGVSGNSILQCTATSSHSANTSSNLAKGFDDRCNAVNRHHKCKLKRRNEVGAKFSPQLHDWIMRRIEAANQLELKLRLSLTIDASGSPSVTTTPILRMAEPAASPGSGRVALYLDPCATNTVHLDPFITHKTTSRDHYVSARNRVNVKFPNEVLLFRPTQPIKSGNHSVVPGNDTDVLTEGSYTNVAFWHTEEQKWCTPVSACLPGIMRQKLLDSGDIIEEDIQRISLVRGTVVKLFNSVRGVFEGVIMEHPLKP